MNHRILTAAGLALAAILVNPATAEAAIGAQEDASTESATRERGKRGLVRKSLRTRGEKRVLRDERTVEFDSEQDPRRKKRRAKKKGERKKKKKKGERRKKGKKKKRQRRGGTPPVGGTGQ